MKLVNKLMMVLCAFSALATYASPAQAGHHHPMYYLVDGVSYPAYYLMPGTPFVEDGVFYNETGMFWVTDGCMTPYVGYFYFTPDEVYFLDSMAVGSVTTFYETVYYVPRNVYHAYPIHWDHPKKENKFKVVQKWESFFSSYTYSSN